MVDHSIGLGDVVGSKYQVERVLGAGGMGMVLAARHLVLGHLVAVKIMRPHMVHRERAIERFLREAQATARFTSQHVTRVLDVGRLDTGAPYIVMEHLRGSDLASLLEQRGPLPIKEAVEYILQACEAIAEAHAARIVHRDIKPPNLFLTMNPDGSPCVKVLDFGIAKMTGPAQPSTSSCMISIGYAAPEQLSPDARVDERTDIWALGVTLHELIAGQLPFPRDSLEVFILGIMEGRPPPLRDLRSDVPAALEAAVLRCLQKQPEQRFPNVAHLAAALVPFAPRRAAAYAERVGAMLSGRHAEPSASPSADTLETALPARAAQPSFLPRFTGILIALVSLGGFVAFMMALSARSAGSTPDPTPISAGTAESSSPRTTDSTAAAPLLPPGPGAGPPVSSVPAAASAVVVTTSSRKANPPERVPPILPTTAPRPTNSQKTLLYNERQ